MDFEVPVILFLAVVAPIWIIAHYATRWRATKSLSSDDGFKASRGWLDHFMKEALSVAKKKNHHLAVCSL